jgi:P-type Cu+ transporter
MTKTIRIDGMNCAHCAARIERALEALPGIKAWVSLEKKEATIESAGDVDERAIENAIADAGYTMLK